MFPTRRLLVVALATGCGDAAPGGGTHGRFVLTVTLDDKVAIDEVAAVEAIISRDGGFGTLGPTQVASATAHTEDRDGDGALELVLAWAKAERTLRVNLGFPSVRAERMRAEAVASDVDGGRLAEGGADLDVGANGTGEAELLLTCVRADCTPAPADGGESESEAEAESESEGESGAESEAEAEGEGEPAAVVGEVGATAGVTAGGSFRVRGGVGHLTGATVMQGGGYKARGFLVTVR